MGTNPPHNPLSDAMSKASRAAAHFQSLKSEVQSFLAGDPYVIEMQVHEQDEQLIGAVRFKQEFPRDWPLIIGEIAHNLRSALDYIAIQLVLRKGNTPTNKNQFPIFETAAGFKERGEPQMLKGIGSNSARKIIESVQPFSIEKPTESPLWHLAKLSNMDKHRRISVVCCTMPIAEVGSRFIAGANNRIYVCAPGPLKDDAPLFWRHIPPGPGTAIERAQAVHLEGKASFYVGFEQPEELSTLEIVTTLQGMGTAVNDIVKRFAKEEFGL